MKTKIVFFLIVIIGGAGGYWYYMQTQNKEIDYAALYKTQEITKATVSQIVTSSGNIRGKDEISVFVDRTQTVSKVHVTKGDKIAAGDLIVEYDIEAEKKDLENKRQQAELNLKNATLSLQTIAQPPSANELVQYSSDISTAEKNIFDAEYDIKSLEIKISIQQTKVDEAKKTLDKNETLYDSGIITKTEYDNSVTACKTAEDNLSDLVLQRDIKNNTLEDRRRQKSEAELKLVNAQNKLSEESNAIKYTQQQNNIKLAELEIKQIKDDLMKLIPETVSPVSGIIAEVYSKDGGVASKGSEIIRILDMSEVIAESDVSEYDVPLLKLQQRVEVTTSGLPDQVYAGIVRKIAEAAIEKEKPSGTEVIVPVEVAITNPDEKLKTGFTVDLEFYIQEKENVFAVPIGSLVEKEDKKYIYILDNNSIKELEVTTGLYGDRTVEITSGVTGGEQLIIDPSEIKE